MSETAIPETVEGKPAAVRYGIISITIAALFGLFYAYDVWEAVSNLIALPSYYGSVGLDGSYVPWWLLWTGILIPPIIFGLALLVGRRRTVFGRALILLVGLSIVAGLSLGVLALGDVVFRAALASLAT